MGACLSDCLNHPKPSSVSPPPPTAKVISLQGHLREYPVPISVSRVLQTENSSSSLSDSFLCNSDRLYYDDFIPPLPLDEQLLPNQIYFLLPSSNLHHRLSASQMAALAVKASLALQNASPNDRRKKGRVSPLLNLSDSDHIISKEPSKKNAAADTSASPSVRKLQRLTSKRAKMAVRSFKLKLSTIYEGAVL
ncbi:uncharacterized protein LOC111446101 [Cucurbita moschata]|uniref:Uncharacterized protein LOC111446101 n=1 Tax=Cucurbita moschata TaxID=3662 RepID=A0A6J1FIQ7_CUCMO|nr:uncharacterized protein LOC111446101 [Cucurbita moschata]